MNPHAQTRRVTPSTGDAVARVDDELRRLRVEMKACRARGEHVVAQRLAEVIDGWLEQRRRLTSTRRRGELPHPVFIVGATRGSADTRPHESLAHEAGRAHALIAEVVRERLAACTDVRVRLATIPTGVNKSVIAQVNAISQGRRIRIQAAALSLRAVLDVLMAVAEARVSDGNRAWSPRPNPDPARARALAPPVIWRNDGEIARVKTVTPAV
ncbi:MAG TPA: hypothetical protein VL551_20525 [Actinospica sp.]|nr:hypothetical protein [Actinospica sp.]